MDKELVVGDLIWTESMGYGYIVEAKYSGTCPVWDCYVVLGGVRHFMELWFPRTVWDSNRGAWIPSR
jgi:hypothetical protein